MDVEWHFFGSYHGNSPCDAVGGNIKRMAPRASLQCFGKNHHVTTPTELFNFVRSKSADLKLDVEFRSESEYV